MTRLQRTSALATFLLACIWLYKPASAEVEYQITTDRVARTFFTGEHPALALHADFPGETIPYSIQDYSGRNVKRGKLRLSKTGAADLRLPPMRNGIYYLTLTFPGDEEVRDAFCVIPRPWDSPGDDALWGFQSQFPVPDLYRVMVQAGVRYIRFDVSWPDHEIASGRYNTSKVDTHAAVLPQMGLQMIPTLGYTPGWTAVKPDNYEGRSHTWFPDAVENWDQYVRLMRDKLADINFAWPPEELFPEAEARQTVPLVRAWEIWNEADQNFYYGPWSRYLDLLRVAHGVIKRHSHHSKVIYGGACGHWSEMGITVASSGHYYFDEISWHSNRNIEAELPKYNYGSPQLCYKYRLPRPTVQTECYPVATEGVPEAEYLMRLYTTLKAYRVEGYCYSSIGGRLVGAADPNSLGLTHMLADGTLVPNAKYVAYASTRWLLADAVYVGPVDLGEGVVAHLLARNGKALLVAWADEARTATIALEKKAHRLDAMGGEWPLRGREATVQITGSPLVILGVGESYFAEALTAYFEQCMGSEYGFPYHVDSSYLRTLEVDANHGTPLQGQRLRAAASRAIGALGDQPTQNARELDALGTAIRQAMRDTATTAARLGDRLGHTLWRENLLAEWIGEASDAIEDPALREVREVDGQLWDRLEGVRDLVADDATGKVHPVCEALTGRAFRMARVHLRTKGQGALKAAETAAEIAELHAAADWHVVREVFAVAHIPTARQMHKGMLLRPGQTHQMQVQVYNYSNTAVSGTLNWHLPDGWTDLTGSVDFTCGAGSRTARIPYEVSIPGTPQPWVLAWAYTPSQRYCVSVPPTLQTKVLPVLRGVLSDGSKLLDMTVELGVGEWVPGGQP